MAERLVIAQTQRSPTHSVGYLISKNFCRSKKHGGGQFRISEVIIEYSDRQNKESLHKISQVTLSMLILTQLPAVLSAAPAIPQPVPLPSRFISPNNCRGSWKKHYIKDSFSVCLEYGNGISYDLPAVNQSIWCVWRATELKKEASRPHSNTTNRPCLLKTMCP